MGTLRERVAQIIHDKTPFIHRKRHETDSYENAADAAIAVVLEEAATKTVGAAAVLREMAGKQLAIGNPLMSETCTIRAEALEEAATAIRNLNVKD